MVPDTPCRAPLRLHDWDDLILIEHKLNNLKKEIGSVLCSAKLGVILLMISEETMVESDSWARLALQDVGQDAPPGSYLEPLTDHDHIHRINEQY